MNSRVIADRLADADWAAGLLAGSLASVPIGRIHVRADPAQAHEVGGSRLTPVPYIAWCLAGAGRWSDPAGPGLGLEPGTVLVCHAHSFVNLQHTGPIRLLRLTCDPAGLVLGENRISAVRAPDDKEGVLTLHVCNRPPEAFLLNLVDRLLERGDGPGGVALLRVLLDECAVQLQKAAEPERGGPTARRYRQLLAHLQEHLAEDPGRDAMARLLGCSPAWLSRICRRHGGGGFQDLVRDLRIRRAEQLLTGTDLPVQLIARHCGFSSANYFAQVFRQLRACSPREWRAGATRM